MSEKHPDFEIEPVNTIQSPEIEYTQMPQALVPIDTPLSIICKHIPRQSDIDKIVKNIETRVIHSLELPIQAQDLIKAYQHSTHFHDIYQYITDGKLPSSAKAQNCIRTEALNVVLFLCGSSPFKFKSFSIKFRIWNNSLSYFMCSTSKIY